MGNRTMTIGELALRVKSADIAANVVDTAVAAEFDVEVEYSYQPFEPASCGAEAIPAECEVKHIKASANIHFEGDISDVLIKRGSDIKDLFSSSQVASLEDQIIKAIEKERGDDA